MIAQKNFDIILRMECKIYDESSCDNGVPLLEYPRPQFRRDSYISLNGSWDYAITLTDNKPTDYDGKITVPFCVESELSGVRRQLKANEFLHYRKVFKLPSGFMKNRLIVNFGAVDQVCKVYFNGSFVGEHKGGYLPFSFELINVKDENELYVLVTDDADSDVYARGKQRYKSGMIWYTATSGIWQSVWLESVNTVYIKQIKITPSFAEKKLRIKYLLSEKAKFSVCALNGKIEMAKYENNGDSGEAVLFLPPDAEGWTANNPKLYDLVLKADDDVVYSYFGLRDYSTVKVGDYKFFGINGEPVFHNGLLDQGYYEKGFYTPKSNEVMLDELKRIKQLGYNTLRVHAKIQPAIWYYYCDVLGILVWQDIVNGGAKYSALRIALRPFIKFNINDVSERKSGRNKLSREQFMNEAYATLDALYNSVCVCLYTTFNEAWGQFDAVNVTKKLKARDGTRLYDHASGWQDKGGGDVNSRHVYFVKPKLKNDFKRVLALTEFGGYAFSCDETKKRRFGYKNIRSSVALTRAYEKLYYKQVVPLILRNGLGATIYTQVSDVEQEINGIFTETRSLKMSAERIKEINETVYRKFDELVKSIK